MHAKWIKLDLAKTKNVNQLNLPRLDRRNQQGCQAVQKTCLRCYITETRTMMAVACLQNHRSTGIERVTADQATSKYVLK